MPCINLSKYLLIALLFIVVLSNVIHRPDFLSLTGLVYIISIINLNFEENPKRRIREFLIVMLVMILNDISWIIINFLV